MNDSFVCPFGINPADKNKIRFKLISNETDKNNGGMEKTNNPKKKSSLRQFCPSPYVLIEEQIKKIASMHGLEKRIETLCCY